MEQQRMGLLSVMQTFNRRVYEGKPVVLFERNQSLPPPPEPVKAVPVDRMCSECRLELSATEFDGGGDVCRWCEVRTRKPIWRTCTACEVSKVIEDFSPTRIGGRMRVCKPCVQSRRNGSAAPALLLTTPAAIAIDCSETPAPPISKPEPTRCHVLDWAKRIGAWEFEGAPHFKHTPRIKTPTHAQMREVLRPHYPSESMQINPKPATGSYASAFLR